MNEKKEVKTLIKKVNGRKSIMTITPKEEKKTPTIKK